MNVSDVMRMLRQRPQAQGSEQGPSQVGRDLLVTTLLADSAGSSPGGAVAGDEPSPIAIEWSLDEHAHSGEVSVPDVAEPTFPMPGYRLAAVSVDLIRLDPRQPRRTLPDDLREVCVGGRMTLREALLELCRRGQDGEPLAALRVAQLQELANNIRQVGLEYPPKVVKAPNRDGSFSYRLKDGERRFWAWLLLLASADEAERAYRASIPAIIEDDDVSPERILKSQWATNLHRERVPVVDIADYILSVRDTHAARLQVDPESWLASLGADWAEVSIPVAVAELTGREVAAFMGKRMGRAMLLRYLAIAEKLRLDVKAIARVRQFGLRQCEWLARLGPVHQLEAAQRIQPNDDEGQDNNAQSEAEGRGRTSGAGRPKLLDGRITMLVRVTSDVGRDKETSLRKADPVKLQELRQATTDAIGALQGYVRLIDRSLADAGPIASSAQSNSASR